MLLSFNEDLIKLKVWEDLESLYTYLEGGEQGHLLLGVDGESLDKFYSLSIEIGGYRSKRFLIGVCSADHGLEPHLLLEPARELLGVGFDQEAVFVDVATCKTKYHLKLDSLFRSFLRSAKGEPLLVFHEIGVLGVLESGEVSWHYEADVIEDFELLDNILKLDFMDSESVEIDIRTGATSLL